MPSLGQMLPYVLRLATSDRRWCLWGILDHTGGPARSASIQPISDVAPALLPFYPFSCAVVRSQRMTHWWRSQNSFSGRLLHDALKGRSAGLFRSFSSQKAHQLNEI